MEFDFQPGERVSYCGDEAVVVSNHGSQGTVRFDDGSTCSWYWMFDGEPVRRVNANS